jgi:formamidopyrimidine-DNA glycosylase
MSIELPEAQILARQMNAELRGKGVKSCRLQNCQKLQKIGFVNKDLTAFDRLINGKVESVSSRGTVIRLTLDNGTNLILAPEYGGRILFHAHGEGVSGKFHLELGFSDGTALTVALMGMGVIQALKDDDLEKSYVYKRDLSSVPSPVDHAEFTFASFSKQLTSRNTSIKSAMVGKDAAIVGLSNSAFQDILYRAKIHPKRRASELTESEKHALYDAIGYVIRERIKLGGKDQFADFYGKRGGYTPAMGPAMKDKTCPSCGAQIEKLSLGGGQVYFCPKCQK